MPHLSIDTGKEEKLRILYSTIQEVKKDLGNWLKTWRWHPRAVKSQLVVAGHRDHLFLLISAFHGPLAE